MGGRGVAARLVAAGMVAVFGMAGCADDVGDVDRVQPDYHRKSDFEGVWYLRDTVVKVPSTSSVLFTGYTGELEKVRWVITEDALFAYRAYELIPGNESAVGEEKAPTKTVICDPKDASRCETYFGAPIAAYAITSHFDIQRDYNPSTGEQSNVIVENTSDRPWYDRAYMRVDWSDNRIGNVTQIGNLLAKSGLVPMVRYVGQGGERDGLVVERDAQGVTQYLDFTGRYYVDPVDCIYGGVTDCTAAEIEVRTSIARVPESDFEPLYYDDRMMSRFGFFRTERLTFNRDHGFTESGRILLANRHNIWRQNRRPNPDFDPALPESRENPRTVSIPLRERSPKPLVYFVNAELPEELREGAKAVEASWDRAFRRVVAAAWGSPAADGPTWDCSLEQDARSRAGLEPLACSDPFAEVTNDLGEGVPQMFYVCEVPVTADSPEPCKMGRRIGGGRFFDPTALETWTPRLGDVRYNFLYWVPDPQLAGPLGYGPSSADPETGEIVSATAFLYGAAIDTYAQQALDTIDLLNGEYRVDEFTDGLTVQRYIAANRDALDPRKHLERLPEAMRERPASDMDRELLPDELRRKLDRIRRERLLAGGVDRKEAKLLEAVDPHGFRERMSEVLARAPFPAADDRHQRFARKMETSAIADRLLASDEIQNAILAASPTPEGQERIRRELASNLAGERQRRERRLQAAARDSIWLAEFADDAVAGLAMELKKRLDAALAGIPPTDVAQIEAARAVARREIKTLVKNRIFQAVTEHEVGHTVGLRHNFQGSFDSVNYHPHYWELRRENLKPLRQFVSGYFDLTLSDMLEMASLTERQRTGRMHEYQYSSVMDYHSRFNSDIHGLGRYDQAAVIFAYAAADNVPGPVEVFAEIPEADPALYLQTDYTARTALLETEVPLVPPGSTVATSRIARPSPAHDALVEAVHYTRLPELFGDSANHTQRVFEGARRLSMRRLVPYAEMQEARDWMQAKLNELAANGGLTVEAYVALANERTLYEVPYLFCSDEWVGALASCQRWDAGADYREQQLDVIDRYRNYYWFTHFKRDRYGWSSFNVLDRLVDRYFQYLPNSYQHWLFSQFVSSMDARQLRYWTLGVFEGFNLLNSVLATPPDGAYGYLYRPGSGDPKVYQRLSCPNAQTAEGRAACEEDYRIRAAQNHWTVQQELLAEGCVAAAPGQPTTRAGWLAYYDNLPDAEKAKLEIAKVEFFLPKGEGRPRDSRYDHNSGYFLFDKVLESGSFWDQLAAMITLVQSDFTVLGVETQSDFRRYSIPYYLAFSGPVTDTFSGIYLEEQSRFAARVRLEQDDAGQEVAVGIQHRAPMALRWFDCLRDANGNCTGVDLGAVYSYPAGPSDDAPLVQRSLNWTDQIYAALYSMAFLTSASFSQDFADLNKIYRLGSGEALDAGAGHEAVTFHDPFRGHVFAAIKPAGVSDPAQFPPGARLIDQANTRLAEYQAARSAYEADRCDLLARDTRDRAEAELNQTVDFLNVMRALYEEFGRNF